jgi:hypothetical protein
MGCGRHEKYKGVQRICLRVVEINLHAARHSTRKIEWAVAKWTHLGVVVSLSTKERWKW